MDKFTFYDFLHILIGLIGTASVLILVWLVQDYFKFKYEYAREALTRSKWEELCAQYRNTCDARLCRKLEQVAKTMAGCSQDLAGLTKELTILQTKMEPQAEKFREVDILKEKIVRLETECEKFRREVENAKKNFRNNETG
jgi:chromosome segregation ATPase